MGETESRNEGKRHQREQLRQNKACEPVQNPNVHGRTQVMGKVDDERVYLACLVWQVAGSFIFLY